VGMQHNVASLIHVGKDMAMVLRGQDQRRPEEA
jgi:hypothetical protein